MTAPGRPGPELGRPSRWRVVRLSRPAAIFEGTRWLFWLLTVLSLIFVAAPTLGSPSIVTVTLTEALVLAALGASSTAGYLTRRQHWSWDVADACLVVAAAALAPKPGLLIAYVMAMLWFRSMYGTTGGAFVRVGLLAAAMVVGAELWTFVPRHSGSVDIVEIFAVIPTMLVTTVIGRKLAVVLAERETAAARDAIHAAAGARLLGVTDPDEILAIAWKTTAEVCAATPGLRALHVTSDGSRLEVNGHAGDFAAMPATLPSDVIGSPAPDGSAQPSSTTLPQLDTAAGGSCTWRCASLSGDGNGAWLVIGATAQVPQHAVDTLTGLVMQVILALRSSRAHRELTVQATMDSLTGLANRSTFNRALASALASSGGRSSNDDTAVLFVDLDDFKDVNDILGHASGDELLREVASRLRAATRAQDLCARLGGDEFAVLMYRTKAETAVEVGHRIVRAVSAPASLDQGVAHVGASVGVAVCSGDTSPEQLVQHADVAMYAAKAAGKGRVQVFADGLLRSGDAALAFEGELLAATREGQLSVLYQPVVSLADGRCTAVEALVRWTHPARGLLLPEDFLSDAERLGAIRDIDSFVLRTAIAEGARWRTSGHPLRVHVNISTLHIDSAFRDDVVGCLEEFGLPADHLVLEVTETILHASKAVVVQLEELAECGVGIAIDDFGTGLAALTVLRSLPVSVVKIDASFVAGSRVVHQDRAVVEAILQLASRLGLQTIAEGLERPEQQELFASLGATSAQGFLYLRPTSPAGLTSWLDGHPPAQPLDHGVVLPFRERGGPTAG